MTEAKDQDGNDRSLGRLNLDRKIFVDNQVIDVTGKGYGFEGRSIIK